MILLKKVFGLPHSFILGLLILIATGCEKDVSDEVNTVVKPKLAIFSFISPQDTVLVVKVYKTQTILGFSQVFDTIGIRDATVTLATDNKSATLGYKRQGINREAYYGVEAAALPIVPGKTYTLTVATPDGLRATGVCTIPRTEGITITDLMHTEQEKQDEWSPNRTYVDHTFDFKFRDAPGSNSYYRTDAYYKFKNNQNGGRLESFSMSYDNRKTFITDTHQNGLVLDAPTATFSTFEDNFQERPYTLFAHLSVTDRSYYLYHQSLDRQIDTDGNPFAEPTIIYTNIQGGFGVFCGYNQLKASLLVE